MIGRVARKPKRCTAARWPTVGRAGGDGCDEGQIQKRQQVSQAGLPGDKCRELLCVLLRARLEVCAALR